MLQLKVLDWAVDLHMGLRLRRIDAVRVVETNNTKHLTLCPLSDYNTRGGTLRQMARGVRRQDGEAQVGAEEVFRPAVVEKHTINQQDDFVVPGQDRTTGGIEAIL